MSSYIKWRLRHASSNENNVKTYEFEGEYVKCKDLKDALRNKFFRKNTMDQILIHDAQTGKECVDGDLIRKGSALYVSRFPMGDCTPIYGSLRLHPESDQSQFQPKMDVTQPKMDTDVSQPIMDISEQPNAWGQPNASKQTKMNIQPMDPTVPKKYVCRICFTPGHWIQNCPSKYDHTVHPTARKPLAKSYPMVQYSTEKSVFHSFELQL